MSGSEKRENYDLSQRCPEWNRSLNCPNFAPTFALDPVTVSKLRESMVKKMYSDSLGSLKKSILDRHLHIRKRHWIKFHVNNIFIVFVSLEPI